LSKESGSFLKKSGSPPRTKKLPLIAAKGVGAATAHGPDYQSFFASFCSQKEVLPSFLEQMDCFVALAMTGVAADG
jgi:hypothetical protein